MFLGSLPAEYQNGDCIPTAAVGVKISNMINEKEGKHFFFMMNYMLAEEIAAKYATDGH